jgi:predicted nucleic acid-binding protein
VTAYILDASVAAKWLLPSKQEPLAVESMQLLDQFASGKLEFSVPDLFWPEMGNILWKAVGAGRIAERSAFDAIGSLRELTISTWPSDPLISDALSIAVGFKRTVYDAMYVALAIASNRPLVTADERLANSLGARFPVRWLGSVV